MKKCCIALLAALAVVGCGTSTSPDGGNTTTDRGSGFTIGGVIQTAGAGGLVLGTAGEPNLTIPSSATLRLRQQGAKRHGLRRHHRVTGDVHRLHLLNRERRKSTVDNANVTSVLVSCAIQLP